MASKFYIQDVVEGSGAEIRTLGYFDRKAKAVKAGRELLKRRGGNHTVRILREEAVLSAEVCAVPRVKVISS